MNPALMEMLATDRIRQLPRANARPAGHGRCSVPGDVGPARPLSARRDPLASPQHAIGWFLVSVGLRLALPRSGPGSAR